MLSIPINKDPFAYRRKVVFGLTDRMLGYSAAALASGAAMGAYLTWVLAVPPSSLLGQVLIAAVAVPFFCMAFVRPHGIDFEVFARLWARKRFQPQRISYIPTIALAGLDEPLKGARHAEVEKAYRKLAGRRGVELWEPDGSHLE